MLAECLSTTSILRFVSSFHVIHIFQIPGYRLLSPKVDPDLLRQARRPARPNYRREAPDCVGEWPIPLDEGRLIHY